LQQCNAGAATPEKSFCFLPDVAWRAGFSPNRKIELLRQPKITMPRPVPPRQIAENAENQMIAALF
jgi:hypothetical protein